MGQPWNRQPHTLAQLARRAGISEGRARALHAARPSGLPRPDATDADGRPLWWASTIDAWCARTGRKVSKDSLWLLHAPAATTPPVELRRGPVTVDAGWGRSVRLYAIVWDTEHGHVVYLAPLGEGAGGPDEYSVYAGQLIEPRWWAGAVVITPFAENLQTPDREPIAYIYRLAPDAPEPGSPAALANLPKPLSGLARWWARTRESLADFADRVEDHLEGDLDPEDEQPLQQRPEARSTWVTHLELSEIATVLGTRIPLWINGTATEEAAARTLAYDRTFTVPDTTTDWPDTQRRLQHALDLDLPQRHPAAWSALALDALDRLETIRAAHAGFPDSAPGWYLVARPALPAPPVGLEQRLTATDPVTDTGQIAAELTELRALEANTDHDEPAGEVYAAAIVLLAWQLREVHAARVKKQRGARPRSQEFVPVADDELIVYEGDWDGPVVQAWQAALTEVPDTRQALRLRRVQRLLSGTDPETVKAIYRDSAGRYVLVYRHRDDELLFTAEWPVSAEAVSTWTDATVLAADGPRTCSLFALTPTDTGNMRVDPVPMQARSGRNCFAYGYSGGTPAVTYRAIMRCVLTEGEWAQFLIRDWYDWDHGENDQPVSQLWAVLSTTSGPLRLSWPQLKLWARADKNHVLAAPDTTR